MHLLLCSLQAKWQDAEFRSAKRKERLYTPRGSDRVKSSGNIRLYRALQFSRMHAALLAAGLDAAVVLVAMVAVAHAPARAQSRPPQMPQPVDPQLYAGMRWRQVGPFRGGRALAVAGVPSEPTVFYFGSVGGGLWKSENSGLTWQPLFQREPVASIGAIAVAPSDPHVIYVGTGEADMRSDISIGDGMYKSTDAGRTWTHLGLDDTQHIARILVDPRNPNQVLVAALGHAYDANAERGIFRSTDGGKSWQKVLYKNDKTGAIDLAASPENPRVVYAALWETHRTTWSQYPPISGPDGGIYKSIDEGQTWHQLSGHGLPTVPTGRIGLTAGSGNRIYAVIDCEQGGLYRSDDGGESWQHASSDPRIWGRGWYFSRVTVDPKNPDVVWVPNVALYRSTDGGHRFDAVKGSPGGDDYHVLWIDPENTERMILGSDQGTMVSVDGGRTWGSWYNQPTAQFYHVVTDHRVPYWIYGAQQDSGSVGTISRSDYGALTFRDWHSIGAGESGYIAVDPANPDVLYGGDTYGVLHKWNMITTQSETISPSLLESFGENIAKVKYRFTWTSPLVFSPQNPHLLCYGSQYLLETTDGGSRWSAASPDLTLRPGTQGQPQRGVIYTIAPSAIKAGEIWVGTDNGLIQLTEDGGKTWHNVTPPGVEAWSKISLIEASHFDAGTAYAAVDRHRLGDIRPYIYITHNYGRSWTEMNDGISAPSYVHAVKEDPVRRGLLFAGTETGVFVSFDEGAHWQSLQLNLPTSPVRDLAIEQGDLIAATHGRAFWVLDDISPLRQLSGRIADSAAHLFRPRATWRMRRSTNTDTPLQPEAPMGQNPPSGAIFYYWLKSRSSEPVTLEILDANDEVVRKYSSAERPKQYGVSNYPVAPYWMAKRQELSADPGMHRFVWDLHYPAPQAVVHVFPISAIPYKTPLEPQGALAAPGRYAIRLTINGHTETQPLLLKMDPRAKTSQAGLVAQTALARKIVAAMDQSYAVLQQAKALQRRLQSSHGGANGAAMSPEAKKLDALIEGDRSLASANAQLNNLLEAVESADVAPTINAQQTWAEVEKIVQQRIAAWKQIESTGSG
jgi:photosystem II stability/assembly factor-like uncharacterized protein